MRTTLLLIGITACSLVSRAGDTLRVLFIGNSYTYVNDLPQTIKNLANSNGDQLIFNSSAPGGYTFQQHTTNATTLSLIAQGNWDYVVLQEQSQLPSFPDAQVTMQCYPYARKLDSLVKAQNSCAKTVFYMTWGRKNGDADNCGFFPPVCTYMGMDSLLQLRYTNMANMNHGVISPVAKVWRSLRASNPAIELYDADMSHPSPKGTYAAAATFYSVLFKKDPLGCTFNGSLSAQEASIVKTTAKQVAYDQLNNWYQYNPFAVADFNFNTAGNTTTFTNSSTNATQFLWIFGDGNTATTQNAVHTYAQQGNYQVKLVAGTCNNDRDTLIKNVTIGMPNSLVEVEKAARAGLFPNPANGFVTVYAKEKITAVTITDLAGRVVYTQNVAPALETKLDINNLAPGLYNVLVHCGNHTAVIKLKHL